MSEIKFQVDPRIALLLSEGYRSTEVALKELVDNAWDADADNVDIILPKPLSKDPIIVKDDGSGMTEVEIEREYLVIASNRRSRRGEITPKKKRKVKGRKGIGKFAGLMASSTMYLETTSRGKCCSFTLNSSDLTEYKDLDGMPIMLNVESIELKNHGTKIILTELVQGLKFPNPDRLRQILMYEYGRENDFNITVDGKPLGVDDIQGDYTELNKNVVGVGDVNLRFTISDNKKKHRQAGIVVKVEGKVIGEPTFFGLDEDEEVPKKLLHKLYGEVEASGLFDHVTSDWGALIENSELFDSLKEYIRPILKERYKVSYGNEIHLAQARIKKKYHKQLSALPEHKREYAEKALFKIIQRYYQEPESKIDPIVKVVLDAFEKTGYHQVLEHISQSKSSDIETIAEALSEFGMVELALMVEQTNSRLVFLDRLEELCENPDTLEESVHKAIENNLWIFGQQYTLFSSNKTLKKQVETYLLKKYKGKNSKKRPDLLLNENINEEYCLIEFKRPKHRLKFKDYQQATEYRNDFGQYTEKDIRVLLIGGRRGDNLPSIERREKNVKILVFSEVISSARKGLDWMLKELKRKI